jgi:hypothetical protein
MRQAPPVTHTQTPTRRSCFPSVVEPVGIFLLRQQSNEVFPRVMKARLYRIDGHIQNVGNLLATVSLHITKEHRSALFRHARKNIFRALQFLRHFHLGEGARTPVEELVENVIAARGERLKPEVAAVLAKPTARDAIEPSGHVVAIKGPEPAAGDEKNLLGKVLGVGVRGPQRPQPLDDLTEPDAIDGRQVRPGFARADGTGVRAR